MKTKLERIRSDPDWQAKIGKVLNDVAFHDILDVLDDMVNAHVFLCRDPTQAIQFSAMSYWRDRGFRECLKRARNFDDILTAKQDTGHAADKPEELFDPEEDMRAENIFERNRQQTQGGQK